MLGETVDFNVHKITIRTYVYADFFLDVGLVCVSKSDFGNETIDNGRLDAC